MPVYPTSTKAEPTTPDGGPAPSVSTERCNHFDDDGNGEVDEGCPCTPGKKQACYPGPASLAASEDADGVPTLIGACKMGTQICQGTAGSEFGSKWGRCEAAVTPQKEICGDGIDQDCDGKDLACADPCDTPALLTVTDSLTFGNPGGCPWGSNGNLSEKDMYLRARVEQPQQLKLPPGAIICKMEWEIPGQGMWYDDYMWVTFNDAVLMSAVNFTGLPTLKKQGDLVFYDWNLLKGMSYASLSTGPSPFCLGQDKGLGSCTLPGTENSGTIAFKLEPSMVQQLAQLGLAQNRYELKVVSAGDNDDTDCSHTPFTFNVTTHYVKK
jgi:hypothetical protein